MIREQIVKKFGLGEKEAENIAQLFEGILDDETKRMRAEVLAPIKALVDKQAEDEGLWYRAQTSAEGYVQQELRRLHAVIELQPAASVLEALLRRAELDGRLAEIDHFCSHQETLMVGPPFSKAENIRQRVVELEKARAILSDK